MRSRTLADVLERTEEIADRVVAEEAEEIDQAYKWPARTFEALQDAGLGGLVVPTEHGGVGLGLLGLTRVCEVLGRQSGSAAISFGMHNVGAAVIAAKATEHQVEAYLEPISRGEHITTLALSEPGTGAHFYFPETQLQRLDDETFQVDGTKSFATNGGHADSYVVSTTAADPEAPPGLFSCVVVGGDNPGLSWHGPFEGFGMRGNSSRTFDLEAAKIPATDLLGEQGDQIWYVFNVVAPYFLVAMAGTYLGLADRAIEACIEDLKGRIHSHRGSGPAHEPVVQHKLGETWARLASTRRLCYWAAEEADRGGPEALPALASAKAEVAGCAVDVINEVMTMMGGRAYRDSSLLPRLLRDARAADVMAPTTDILRTWTGRALLDIPLLGE